MDGGCLIANRTARDNVPAVTICRSILGICGESGGRGGCHIFGEPRMGRLGVQGSQRFTMRHYGCERQMVVD